MNYRRAFIKNGLVFITIVTHNRLPLLTEYINVLKNSFINTLKIYKFKTIAYVIQPDHIHCIIKPKNIFDYPNIIKSFKYSFTKNVGLVKPTYNDSNYHNANRPKIWQDRYWEHTIRDENDLNIHLNYIHYNPEKHNFAKNVKDWEFSSFHKFVRQKMYNIDWGTGKDIDNIKDLNFE